MRTKTLLLTAAAMAAGLFSASAQVYSVNVVGYVNMPLQSGFQVVATPLDLDGSGNNNTVTTVFGNSLPVNSAVYVFNGAGYNSASFTKNKAGTSTNWDANLSLNPGLGYWVSIPAGSGTVTNTVVGTVLQGSLANTNVLTAGGFALISSKVPQAGGVTTVLRYLPQVNDTIYTYANPGWNSYSYTKNKAGTSTNWDNEPVIGVGQGFWLNAQPGASWVRNFTVQ